MSPKISLFRITFPITMASESFDLLCNFKGLFVNSLHQHFLRTTFFIRYLLNNTAISSICKYFIVFEPWLSKGIPSQHETLFWKWKSCHIASFSVKENKLMIYKYNFTTNLLNDIF